MLVSTQHTPASEATIFSVKDNLKHAYRALSLTSFRPFKWHHREQDFHHAVLTCFIFLQTLKALIGPCESVDTLPSIKASCLAATYQIQCNISRASHNQHWINNPLSESWPVCSQCSCPNVTWYVCHRQVSPKNLLKSSRFPPLRHSTYLVWFFPWSLSV